MNKPAHKKNICVTKENRNIRGFKNFRISFEARAIRKVHDWFHKVNFKILICIIHITKI